MPLFDSLSEEQKKKLAEKGLFKKKSNQNQQETNNLVDKVAENVMIQVRNPKPKEGQTLHYCNDCIFFVEVERFGRKDCFCKKHLKSRQFFDVPNHIEYDYDHSPMCKKINVYGTCLDFQKK